MRIAGLHDNSAGPDPAKKTNLDPVNRTDAAYLRFLPRFLRDKLSDRHILQLSLGNSSWLFWDKIIRMGSNLVVTLWIARYLGPGQFGLLNFAIAFTGLFSAISSLGLDGIVVRELVGSAENKDKILGSAFVLRICSAFLSFSIVMGAIFALRHGEPLVITVVAITSAQFFFQSLSVIDLYFQARVESKYTIYATNSAFLLIALVKVVLLLTSASLVAFAWAGLGEFVLASGFLLVSYRSRGLSPVKWDPQLAVMRKLLRDSWPLILSGISIMISVRIDQVLIGQMLNNKQLGIYSAAARISEVWYFIPFAISTSVLPLLIESKKKSEALYRDRMQKYSNVLAIIGIGFASLITAAATPITRLLYGSAYTGSASVLKILIWSGVPMSIGGVWSNWMLLENRTKTMFFFQVFGAAINVALNLVLIPRLGIVGSAYATLISYGAWIFVLCPFMKSQREPLAIMLRSLSLVWLFNMRKK